METNNIKFTRFTYIFEGINDNVSEYFLRDTEPKENIYQFTEWIQIEKYLHKSNSTKIDLYLRKKLNLNSENKGLISGLRETNIKNVFYADEVTTVGKKKIKKKNLILIQFCPDLGFLILDYFKNFYPYNRNEFIKKHSFEFKEV